MFIIYTAVTVRRRFNSYIVWDQRGLSAAISRRLNQGYYPRVDSMVINAAPRRHGCEVGSVFPYYRFLLFLLAAAAREPTMLVGSLVFSVELSGFSPTPGTALFLPRGFAPRFPGMRKC